MAERSTTSRSKRESRSASQTPPPAEDEKVEKRGSLTAVGTGIRIVGQMTVETIAAMKSADKLLYCVGDPLAEHIVTSMNGTAESLYHFYEVGKPRSQTYEQMVERMLECVREGMRTVIALYGHPGVFAWPAHEAIRRARAEGYYARMLPAVSAEDCLFADLGLDPATMGCQSYEATDFMLHNRNIDSSSTVILWQIGVLGDWSFQSLSYDTSSMPLLLERLARHYPPNHVAIVYEAAVYPGTVPTIRHIPLFSLPTSGVTAMSTLCIPPARAPVLDQAIAMRVGQLIGR
jgi:uncharacterized protein YabN with tetrapyrrole methylase and pyrophosphatase domain